MTTETHIIEADLTWTGEKFEPSLEPALPRLRANLGVGR